MKLKTLKPRIQSAPGRLTQLGRAEATTRLRGQAAVDRRARWLAAHPLCCMCEAEGQVRAADVVDHIIPLWKGGPDDESNMQSLCQTPHHDTKTAQEARERALGV